jgi:hypothetical protein
LSFDLGGARPQGARAVKVFDLGGARPRLFSTFHWPISSSLESQGRNCGVQTFWHPCKKIWGFKMASEFRVTIQNFQIPHSNNWGVKCNCCKKITPQKIHIIIRTVFGGPYPIAQKCCKMLSKINKPVIKK